MEQTSNNCPSKCQEHQNYNNIAINVSNNKNSQKMLCIKCIQFSQQRNSHLVVIQDIINHNSNSILENWPPLNLTKFLYYLKDFKENHIETIKYQITEYFEQFSKDINQEINNCQKRMIQEVDSSEQKLNDMLQKYQQLSFLDQLDTTQLIDSFIQIVNKWNEQQKLNSINFEKNLHNFSFIKWQIDLEYSNTIKTSILDKINSLDILSCIKTNFSEKEKESLQIQEESIESLEKINEMRKQIEMEFQNNQQQSLNKLNALIESSRSSMNQLVLQMQDYDEKKENNTSLNQKFQFIGQNYKVLEEYQQTIVYQINNEQQFKFQFNKNYLMVSKFNLKQNDKYIIRIKFIPNSESNYFYYMGLIPENQIIERNKNFNHASFQSNLQDFELIKGDLYKSDLRQIEVQIWINGGVFKVSNYPNYENIAQYKDFNFQKFQEKYLFGIQASNSIENLIILDCFTVDEYK